MNSKPSPIYAILLLALLCNGASTVASGCIESERNALVDFKRGLRDHAGRLSSWTGSDCCNWQGVACSNRTGHVVRLDLRNPHPFSTYTDDPPYNKWSMGDELRPSLLGLKNLRYLDLSMNYFGGRPIPEFVGSIRNLRYLNLSRAGLGGPVPRQIGNLSSLQYLDLYNVPYYRFSGHVPEFSIDDPLWISGLSSLQHLDMGGVKFRDTSSLVESLNMLPHIVEVRLSQCGIQSIPLSLPHVNFTRLSTLDLSYSWIDSPTIPSWLFNVSSLVHLDLSSNWFRGSIPAEVGNLSSLNVLALSDNLIQGGIPKELGNICNLQTLSLMNINISRSLPELGDVFTGCIKTSLENLELSRTGLRSYLPDWLGELTSLKTLFLSGNSLVGSLPESLGRLTSLQVLQLSYNELNGTVPAESLGGLVELDYLDLSKNLLEGTISEAHLANLTKLSYLDLSSNHLALKFSPNWVPLFRLQMLHVSSCSLGKKFPSWIRNQASISYLFMANAGIVDAMPDWFWVLVVQVRRLDISENAISGRLPINFSSFVSVWDLDLRSNYFYGSLPKFSRNVEVLDLSNNLFSGTIDPAIGESMPSLILLSLSGNKLHGDVPSSLCQLQNVATIDLARNLFSGELPNCWRHLSQEYDLIVLDISSNNLSGGVPDTIGSLSSLEVLHLSNNSLSGEIPSSLHGCTRLTILDLSQNKFTGKIPKWIMETFPSLRILRLRSNMLAGRIPRNLSRLFGLHIVDLAHNNLAGKIPKSFGKFAAMKVSRVYSRSVFTFSGSSYVESLEVVMKGGALKYDDSIGILSLVNALDLSGNNLYGIIPPELGRLRGLMSLNLSGNHLNGEIPKEVGSMQSLVSLDLSRNELSGAIPSTMAYLTFLSYLDLSSNNLSGRIPSGNQLQTFNESTYSGNPGLCGFPVKQICENDDNGAGTRNNNTSEEDGAGSQVWLSYLGTAPGFVVGFWIFWGTLILKSNWKDAYFSYIDRQYDRFYVIVAITFNRCKNSYVEYQNICL
ncbi:putative leucine-rich repeat receptor-like protein kinase [Iris pallida]|uniref:Leucine-rich repeat receptor-like protein kinase n=1 Tax=Iris pallida TaxID=29817 RepID=A0AAX6H7Q1_IRIPA|nr:putative leucine-rich repeat receptor-like protein kinase [Iris pallida]